MAYRGVNPNVAGLYPGPGETELEAQGRATQFIRTFSTGATRDTDAGKLDYEGFLSPIVLERYAQYMQKNRVQADGSLRASDNWTKGIPREQYMKSLWRHFMDVWMTHRGHIVRDSHGTVVHMEDALCAVMFNAMGYLHETLKEVR